MDKDQILEGMERTGIPEGIPSLAEYLAEYCSSAVSPMIMIVNIVICLLFPTLLEGI